MKNGAAIRDSLLNRLEEDIVFVKILSDESYWSFSEHNRDWGLTRNVWHEVKFIAVEL